jgi:hypothetical protein
MAAQRHARIIGLFVRLLRRDGKPDYLPHLPRVWRMFEQAAAHPALEPLRLWFDRHLPPPLRRIGGASSRDPQRHDPAAGAATHAATDRHHAEAR